MRRRSASSATARRQEQHERDLGSAVVPLPVDRHRRADEVLDERAESEGRSQAGERIVLESRWESRSHAPDATDAAGPSRHP